MKYISNKIKRFNIQIYEYKETTQRNINKFLITNQTNPKRKKK